MPTLAPSFTRRLAGFAGLPLLSFLAPLLLLPIIARRGGVDGWAAVVIGQAVGGLAAVLVLYGWNLAGPVRVASADLEERRRLFAVALYCKVLVCLAVLPIVVLLCWSMAPKGHVLVCALMGAAVA